MSRATSSRACTPRFRGGFRRNLQSGRSELRIHWQGVRNLAGLRRHCRDTSVVSGTADGVVEIAGQAILSTHDLQHDSAMHSMITLKQQIPSFPALQRAGVRYK